MSHIVKHNDTRLASFFNGMPIFKSAVLNYEIPNSLQLSAEENAIMKRKSREKFDVGSFILEVALELAVYVPRLVFRLIRGILD